MSTTKSAKLSRDSTVTTCGRTTKVAPNVSIKRLVDACLKYDPIPMVVMGFPANTVGGEAEHGARAINELQVALLALLERAARSNMAFLKNNIPDEDHSG